MKKVIALLLVFAAIYTGAIADGYFVLCTPGTEVNARISPGKRAEVIGRLVCGEYVETDGIEKNGFVHVVNCSFEMSEAWVSKGYLVPDEPTTYEMDSQIIGSGRVAARNMVNGKRTRWVKPGKGVTVFAWSDEWAVTDQGYIRTKFLEIGR